MKEKNIGKKVIVRGDRSGVFFGTLAAREGREVELKQCRRLWKWDGASDCLQLATTGPCRPSGCRFTVIAESITIIDAIEVIPCTEDAVANIEGVSVWRF